MKQCYAVMYEPGENWIVNKPIGEQTLASHVRYLANLHEQGTVKMGGPFADGDAGLVILSADGMSDAREIVRNDPAVVSGVLVAQIREWHRVV